MQSTLAPRWTSEDMETMDSRLSYILSLPGAENGAPTEDVEMETVTQASGEDQLPRGWRKAGANWTPCPIGVYVAA